jgi:hypothetical protein
MTASMVHVTELTPGSDNATEGERTFSEAVDTSRAAVHAAMLDNINTPVGGCVQVVRIQVTHSA